MVRNNLFNIEIQGSSNKMLLKKLLPMLRCRIPFRPGWMDVKDVMNSAHNNQKVYFFQQLFFLLLSLHHFFPDKHHSILSRPILKLSLNENS